MAGQCTDVPVGDGLATGVFESMVSRKIIIFKHALLGTKTQELFQHALPGFEAHVIQRCELTCSTLNCGSLSAVWSAVLQASEKNPGLLPRASWGKKCSTRRKHVSCRTYRSSGWNAHFGPDTGRGDFNPPGPKEGSSFQLTSWHLLKLGGARIPVSAATRTREVFSLFAATWLQYLGKAERHAL